MAKKELTPLEEESKAFQDSEMSLFERATTNLEGIGRVSDHMRIGKRWDVTHKEIRDKVIVLRRGEMITTKYGPAILAQIDFEGKQMDALLGGQVLIDNFTKLEPHLPIVTVIRMPGRSYIFDDPTDDEIGEYIKTYG